MDIYSIHFGMFNYALYAAFSVAQRKLLRYYG